MDTRLYPYGQTAVMKVSGVLISVAEDGMYVLGPPINEECIHLFFALFRIEQHEQSREAKRKELEECVWGRSTETPKQEEFSIPESVTFKEASSTKSTKPAATSETQKSEKAVPAKVANQGEPKRDALMQQSKFATSPDKTVQRTTNPYLPTAELGTRKPEAL